MSHSFIRNCWYVAAWDHEVILDALFERRVIGESLLFLRLASGEVVALENRCCHRHAPLSLGRREGDCIRCMYHGLKFDPTGRCVEIPGQKVIPSGVRVRSYPVVERKRWIWVWMGAPEKADASLIPDTFSLDDPGWRMRPGYMRYASHHLLVSDNLLDFSHLSYVHEGSLGGTPRIADARAHLDHLPRGLRLTRKVLNAVPAPYHLQFGAPSDSVDRWWIYDYLIPGVLLLDSGVKPTEGAPEGSGNTLRFHSCQAVTPENERSTHYFFMQAHAFALEDASVTEALYRSVVAAFEEDRRMIEAQQRLIDSVPPTRMVGLQVDVALAYYRKLYQRLLAEEVTDNVANASGDVP